jgi:hypothetical protein
MGPLGPLSPHPGVSYLFDRGNSSWNLGAAPASGSDEGGGGYPQGQGTDGNTGSALIPPLVGPGAPDNSLWAIANGGLASMPLGGANGVGWTPAVAEMVMKIDGKLKKIITTLLKELDQFARNAIRDELATLDPLLRNMAVADEGRETFDFEGAV